MTTETEKTFFDTFGIEPKYYCDNDYVFEAMLEDECTDGNREKCKTCKKVGKTYPQITDRILLELIRLGLNYDFVIHAKSKDELKEKLLTLLIRNDVEFKQQVRTLFEEGEWN